MPVTFDPAAQPVLIRLEGEIDIAVAAQLRTHLMGALASGRDVRIAVEKVTSLDITAVQLLWAAERQARTSAAALHIDGRLPEPLLAALGEAGFPAFLFAYPSEAAAEVSL